MFWKKKLTNKTFLSHKSKNKRGAYRLHSCEDSTVYVQLDKKRYSVIELSAVGTSFVSKRLSPGEKCKAQIHIQGHEKQIDATIEVIRICPENICHCKFDKIREDDKELIHLFVLHTQKDRIKAEKAKKKRHWFKKFKKG